MARRRTRQFQTVELSVEVPRTSYSVSACLDSDMTKEAYDSLVNDRVENLGREFQQGDSVENGTVAVHSSVFMYLYTRDIPVIAYRSP